MSRTITRVVLAFAFAMPLCGFVPYAHEGVAVLPLDDGLTEGRAIFNSEVSTHDPGLVVQVRFPLTGGGEGYLTLDIGLVGHGAIAPARWTYYEKLSPTVTSFDADFINGRVVVVDRYEAGLETSVYLEFSAILRDGPQERRIDRGFAVTTPSPGVLRAHGALPEGVVAMDDGAGTSFVMGGHAAYERGTIDCMGHVEEEVLVIEHDPGYYDEEYYYDDDYEYPADGSTDDEEYVYEDDYSGDDTSCDGSTDDDGADDGSSDDGSDMDCDSSSDSSGDWDNGSSGSSDTDCDSDSSSDSSSSWDSSSDDSSDSGFDCVGDSEAAPRLRGVARQRGPRWSPAALRGKGSGARKAASRLVALSPMILLLLILFVWREIGSRSTASRPWRHPHASG